MFTQIVYDTRNKSGTTKAFAEKLAYLFDVPCYNVNSNLVKDGKFILCTYTDGLGEVPETTEIFLKEHSHNILGVVGNGSSNFKSMGLFAKVGDIIANRYDVELLKKLDMGGKSEDVIYVGRRLKNKYKIDKHLPFDKIINKSTYVDGKFTFKTRIE